MSATITHAAAREMLDSPASNAFAITASNDDELATATRAVYVGGAGDLHVEMVSGDEVTFVGLSAGSVYPFRVRKVFVTGTDATDLIGLY